MRSPMPWFCLIALANAGMAFADDGVDAYRQGNYKQAAQLLTDKSGHDPIVDYYMGRMRMYGYGQLKNNTIALRHLKSAAERGFVPAQQILGRYALLEEKNPEQALYWFKKAADANDTQAQMYCAAAYLFGVGVKQNSDVARRYYIAAARNGDSIAQYTVAQSFLETHQSANKTLGLLWLNKSVAQNNPEAQVMLGELYARGTLVNKDVNKARELVGLAIAQGYVPAIYQMGEIARLENDLPLAKEWYTKAANAHYSPAEVALAQLYLQDKSPMYDLHTGFLSMLKAAQNGSAEAQQLLSDMYKKGMGTDAEQNLAKEWQQRAIITAKGTPATAQMKAAQWLSNGKATSLAATQFRQYGILSPWNNPVALKENDYNQPPQMENLTRDKLYKPQFTLINPNKIAISEYYDAMVASLGGLTNDPLIFPQYSIAPLIEGQDAKLVQELEKQAVLGNSDAQFDLAQWYDHGMGDKQNIPEAIKYYRLAMAQQDLRAEYNLAILYLNGRDSNTDPAKGMELLEDAAFKGNTLAQYALARIYEQGFHDANNQVSIQPDHEQAMSMYGLAAVNGYGLAQYRLAELLVREKPVDNSRVAKAQRNQMIKDLYLGAVSSGIEQAALPLAFFNAMDADKTKQEQALLVAKKSANAGSVEASLLLGLMYDCSIAVAASPEDAVSWYQKAESNPVGAFLLGTHLSQGIGVSKDTVKGQALLQQAANAGFSYANLNLAVMQQQEGKPFLPELEKALSLGNSTAGVLLADYYLSLANNDQQMKQAHDIYQHIAESGDREGQLKLAYMLEQGMGGPVDVINAQKWYAAAAEQGDPVAQYLLGHFYQLGRLDNKPDYEQAKKWYSSAQTNYAPAGVALGFIYDTVDDDYQHALTGYESAAKSGDAVGQFNAGLMYEQGKGRSVDFEKAADLYRQAAEQGHIKAMVQLADVYLNGLHDQEKALSWYKKAADLGDSDALYQLGLLSETGVATRLDYPEAVRYYRLAANKDNANAKLALARLYQYGLGVPKDIQQATALYKELAAQDNAYAQYQLAMFYYDGTAGKPMSAQGMQLLQMAKDNGSPQARKALQWLATKNEDKTSFLEPVSVAQVPVATEKAADLMYLDALNAWNRGDETFSRRMLDRILNQYPDYTPAKRTYEQLGQGGKLGAWG